MYQTYQNTIAVPAVVLYEDMCLMSYPNYKYYCRSGKINKIRNGGNGRQALIEFSSLPQTFKEAVKNAYGDPYSQDDVKRFTDRLENNIEASRYFDEYIDEDGRGLLPERIAQYYAEAQILDLYDKLIYDIKVKQRTGMRIKIGPAKKEICEVITKLQAFTRPGTSIRPYPHNLPKNYRALDNKLKKYKSEGLQSLIHSAIGNTNSKKIKGAVAEWILGFYMLPNKPVVPVLHTEYMKVRTANGWPILSESAINKWLKEPRQEKLWCYARHGEDYFRNKFGHKMRRDKNKMFPNAYWAIDGSKLDWVHFKDNAQGMGADIKIDLVFDVYSERILGFSFSQTETHGDHFKAIKMAVNNTLRRPFEFSYDGQSGHTTKEMQNLYGKLVANNGGKHYKHAARRHGSPVEGLFSRFQQQVLNTKWFSDKQGVRSKKMDSHVNVDFIKSFKHKLKPWQELERAFNQCVEQWNRSKHPNHPETRMEVYQNHIEVLKEEITVFDAMDMFWVSTKDSRKYTREGIRPIISGKEYHYEVYDADGNIDIDFRDKWTNCKFFVQYDPDQMDNYVRLHVELPNGNRQFIADAQPKRLANPIGATRTKEESVIMRKDMKVKITEEERIKKRVEQIRKRTGLTPEKLVEDQELDMKLGGSLPKERRSEVESLSFLDRM
ncbi:hypothetical protein [Flagellimonas eckloniae]|uniref:Integrase catalytic domain-containing protein n=1 Tax=Flagellimonas eckloniae TaxID=346185 RepID=A0A0Q0XGI7_9FLAO|nr:hypothetical protein [Allomuricauda eckloniae]KQC30205.1 hypothetical protein AAY42_10195 [Allomuricauda eckloniae]